MIFIQTNEVHGSCMSSVLPKTFSSRQGAYQWLRKLGGSKHPVNTPLGQGRTLSEMVDAGDMQAIVKTCRLRKCKMKVRTNDDATERT